MKNKYYHKATRIKLIRPMSNIRKRELLTKTASKSAETPTVEEPIAVEETPEVIEEQVVEADEVALEEETEVAEIKPKRPRKKKVAEEENNEIETQ